MGDVRQLRPVQPPLPLDTRRALAWSTLEELCESGSKDDVVRLQAARTILEMLPRDPADAPGQTENNLARLVHLMRGGEGGGSNDAR
jgi:hypothetical protein